MATLDELLYGRINPLLAGDVQPPPSPNRLLGGSFVAPPEPGAVAHGKGSVQMIRPEATGQHNALSRGAVGLVDALNPFSAAYRIGHDMIGPGIEERSPLQLGLGAGALGLAALPFGVAARRGVTFTPEMREVARRRYGEGASLVVLAEEIGVDVQTLRRHLASEGIAIRPQWGRRGQLVDLPEEQLRNLYEREGMSIASIAERLGVGEQTVAARLRDAGINARTTFSTPRPEDLLARVEALRQQGRTYAQISTELGVTRGAVAGMVRDLRASGRHVPAALLALAGIDGLSE